MQPLRYSINLTLDGCVHHEAGLADAESHEFWREALERVDGAIYGRVTYQMMEEAWRRPADGQWPDWIDETLEPFAEAMDAAKKYVVSSTLTEVDWNSELLQGDLATAVRALKEQPGRGLSVGGVQLPLALANLGLIDEYEFVIHPVIAGFGPTLLSGLEERVILDLVDRHEFRSGAVLLRYRPRADA